jgi:hypothetical protein
VPRFPADAADLSSDEESSDDDYSDEIVTSDDKGLHRTTSIPCTSPGLVKRAAMTSRASMTIDSV